MNIHKIVLRLDQKTRRTSVSCECRASDTRHAPTGPTPEYYEPIGVPAPDQTIWDLYNDPDNHIVEFTDKDKVRV